MERVGGGVDYGRRGGLWEGGGALLSPTPTPPFPPRPSPSSSVLKHGPVFASHLVGTPCIVVTRAADVEAVMLGEHAVTEWWSPPSFVRLLGSASDAGVMADKARHAKRRRQQATAFSPAALAAYAPRVAAATTAALDAWAARPGGVVDDLVPALADLTFEYAEATVVDLGLDAAGAAKVRGAWQEFSQNLFSLPIDLPGTPLRRALRARDRVTDALSSAVSAYKAAFDAGMRAFVFAGASKKGGVEKRGSIQFLPRFLTHPPPPPFQAASPPPP